MSKAQGRSTVQSPDSKTMRYVCKIDEVEGGACAELGGSHYFLVREGDAVRMFSLICPHQGGIVERQDDILICPVHKWRFDPRTGKSLVGGGDLKEIEIERRGEKIFAKIEERAPAALAGRQLAADFEIELVAHACLRIRRDNVTVLIDPWLDGSAFNGAWTQYPPPSLRPEEINPDILYLTHEHSDHFHDATLRHFDPRTPVYFPAFPNRRMDRMLRDMGFSNLHPMEFGREYSVTDALRFSCFEPASNFNDSIHLIEIDRFRILNINDAGVNFRIARHVGPVDLICSSFGSGASGFPLCWTHLPTDRQTRVLCDQFIEKKKMLVRATTEYGCRRIIPFASYFALWHPDHAAYQRQLTASRTIAADLRDEFGADGIEVLDLLPGDTWCARTGVLQRASVDRAQVFDPDNVDRYLRAAFDLTEFERCHPPPILFDERAVESYFLNLGNVPEAIDVECYRFAVHACEGKDMHALAFEIVAGKVRRLPPEHEVNIVLEVPAHLLMHLVKNNWSWDELYIGYWCRFRDENPYNVAFWRMLHSPYYGKRTGQMGDVLAPRASIGSLLEQYGEPARRILGKHGLYCVGCHRATQETLMDGARKHGLSTSEIDILVRELNRAL